VLMAVSSPVAFPTLQKYRKRYNRGMDMASQIPGFYTVPEAAVILGKTPEMVRKYIKDGRLSAKTAGKRHLIEQGDVHTFTPRPRGNPHFKKSQKPQSITTQ